MKWERIALSFVSALALLLALYVLRLHLKQDQFLAAPSDRSWMDGSVTVRPYQEGSELGVKVEGNWPTASPDLWIKYRLGLTQEGSPKGTLVATSCQLSLFQLAGTGVSDYSKGPARHLDLSKPYQAVFDYEIWNGEPGKGELLTKQSVLSAPIGKK
jgi:hypothetical protein